VIFGALDSSGFAVLRYPYNAADPVALRAFCVVADFDYVFVSPFFLLSV
jgi:hypothetical protein